MELNKKDPIDETPASEPNAEPISAAELVAPMGERMPPVTEGQTNEAKPVDVPPKAVPIDKRGISFDPSKHAVEENGAPKITKDGFFYSNRLGKGKHASFPAKAPVKECNGATIQKEPPRFSFDEEPQQRQTQPDGKPTVDEFDLGAEVYLQAAYGPLMIMLSESIRPNEEQHAALKQSLAAWLRFKQVRELSPGWGFVLTATAVIVQNSEKPSVKERIGTWAMRFKGWIGGKKG